MAPSLKDQLAACHRELALRRKLYPLWVKQGSFTLAEADRELDRMAAVTRTIATVLEIDEALRQEDLFESKEDLLADLIQKLVGIPTEKGMDND